MTEDVKIFLSNIKKASDINDRYKRDKLRFSTLFVKGTGIPFLENLENQKGNWTWNDIQDKFLR